MVGEDWPQTGWKLECGGIRSFGFQGCGQIPGLGRIFADGAVGGEDAHPGHVENGFALPFVRRTVKRTDALLRFHVTGEIGEQLVVVAVIDQRIEDVVVALTVVRREIAAVDLVQRLT